MLKSSYIDRQSIYLWSMLRVNISVGNRFGFASIRTNQLSVLARNEEFSKIAVINFFFTVLKKKIQLSVGGILRGKFRDIPRKSTV